MCTGAFVLAAAGLLDGRPATTHWKSADRFRVLHPRVRLEETDLPVDRIAAGAGFGTAASLRQHFRAALGVSPGAYRRTFRGG